MNAAVSLNPYYSLCYMYLGITLARLGDLENSLQAYEKALSMENDFLIHLNYAITLYNNNMFEEARI